MTKPRKSEDKGQTRKTVQPSSKQLERLDQPNQPKRFFFPLEQIITQPTQPTETVDPNRTRP